MSRYLLPCTCGRQVVVTPSEAGNRVTCSCGAVLDVPTLRAMRQLPVAETAAEAPAVPSPASRWNAAAALVLLGAVVVLIGVGLCVYFWSHRPRPVDVDSLRPADTWYLWQQLRQMPRRTAQHDLWIRVHQVYRLWMTLAFAVVALGGALVVVGFLLRKQPASRAGPEQPAADRQRKPARDLP